MKRQRLAIAVFIIFAVTAAAKRTGSLGNDLDCGPATARAGGPPPRTSGRRSGSGRPAWSGGTRCACCCDGAE
jgi:hypothetical protein